MTALPANAKLCHRCGEHYIGRACPKCPPSLACAPPAPPVESRAADVPRLVTAPRVRSMEAPALNKTEQRWQTAHPSHIPFPMSLRWGKCMTYKPDFMERQPIGNRPDATLIEVKGGHIFDRDIVRFKGCAAEWGWLFEFQMWQWKNRDWKRLY